MTNAPAESSQFMADLAKRHDVSVGAVQALYKALVAGGGGQAQFDHPELGGMGQWSGSGMVMVGDMFNADLKAKVDAICTELARFIDGHRGTTEGDAPDYTGRQPDDTGWPSDLGAPSSTGSQNGMRYAVFPGSNRLAIDGADGVEIYDTGDHHIFGAAQQQGGERALSFTSQKGTVQVEDLRRVEPGDSRPA